MLFRAFRGLPEALDRLASAITELSQLHRETGPGEARLEELERSRAVWEAQMEALQLKALSTYKSASNAEARERTMRRSNEKLSDPFDSDSDEAETEEQERFVPGSDVQASEEAGVYGVPVGLEGNGKTHATRMKFHG